MSGEWVLIRFFISIGAIAIVWGYFLYTYKAKAQQQETLKKLIDNGQTLSPELITILVVMSLINAF